MEQQTHSNLQDKKLLQIASKFRLVKRVNLESDEESLLTIAKQPVIMKSSTYKKAQQLTKIWIKLTQLASLDQKFIIRVLTPCKNSPMVGQLLKIYQKLMIDRGQKEKRKPKLSLNRVDYFIEELDNIHKIHCVQYNLFAAGCVGISHSIDATYRQMWPDLKSKLIQPVGDDIYAQSLNQFYKKHKLEGVVIIVSSRFEYLVEDMYHLQKKINSKGLKCLIIPYISLQEELNFDQNNDIYLKSGQRVDLIYFRAGSSVQYDNLWNLKQKIAFSNAISIPWIGIQLINQKRVQAQLSKVQIMKQYLNQDEVKLLSENVTETWDFDTQIKTSKEFQELMKHIELIGQQNFILKPNAQGGSNNIFGQQAINTLKLLQPQERKNYILMRKINSIQLSNKSVKKIGQKIQTQQEKVHFQFSIYGAIANDQNSDIEINNVGGYFIRLKPITSNQSGFVYAKGMVGVVCCEDMIQ